MKIIKFSFVYLKAGTGYAWAGQRIAKLLAHLRSMPDHLTSPDNVGALALTGSTKQNKNYKMFFVLFSFSIDYKWKTSFSLTRHAKPHFRYSLKRKKFTHKKNLTWMLALDMLELDKIEPNHELTVVQSTSVLCHAITVLELYHPQVLQKNVWWKICWNKTFWI